MSQPSGKTYAGIWLLWIAATAVGTSAGAAAAIGIEAVSANLLYQHQPTVLQFLPLILMVTAPGVFQWLIVRKLFERTGWWIPASAVGSFLAFLPLSYILGVDVTDIGAFVSTFVGFITIAAGAVAGTMQVLVLRQWVWHSDWWILATIISALTTNWTHIALAAGSLEHRVFHFPVACAITGAQSGAITGFALVGLLRFPKKEVPSQKH